MNNRISLNNKQKRAVEENGNVLIIAGPGTGKTRTLTHKIAYLLQEKDVNPSQIVALTFTKKAAAEMRERVDSLISNSEFLISKQNPNPNDSRSKQNMHTKAPPLRLRGGQGVLEVIANNPSQPPLNLRGGEIPFIGTFHSLAFEILKKQGIEPKIASEKELAEIIRKICGKYKKVTKGLSDQKIKRYISLYKTGVEMDFPKGFEDLAEVYSASLEKKDILDYDDLLLKALNSALKGNNKYKYILVDEFQDTNDLQYKLIKQLLDKKGNLFVIGDPKQSIYAFRGSNEKIFEKFENDFSNAKKIVLDKNYRSGENIIKSSSALFEDTITLESNNKEKGSVKQVETYNQYSEADWILKEINEKVGGIDLNYAADVDLAQKNYSFADFAVVYRIHSLNKTLEKKFYEFGIPFQVVGSQALYEQKEIKFIILALRYIVLSVSMYRYIDTIDEEGLLLELNGSNNVDEPASLIREKLEMIEVKDKKVSEIVKEIVDKFSLEKKLEKKNIKLQNLKEFVGSTIRFDKQKDGLQKFLEYIKYLEEREYYDERADKVTLMTMHAAKGLEFPFVYIIGFEEEIIPYKKSVEEDNVEEERRLLYVAMTRAEEELHLLSSLKRFGKNSKISRFSKQFTESVLDRIEDPEIKKIKRKIEKSKKKQLGLF